MIGISGVPRRTWVIVAGLVLLTAIVSRPCYRWWYEDRTERFRTQYDQAVDASDWKRAEQIAARWVQWDPSSGRGWLYLAEATKELGDLEKTAECLGNVQDSDRSCLRALALRGDLLFTGLNRPYEAVENWKRMLRIDPLADLARQRLIYFYAMTLSRQAMMKQIRAAMDLHCEPREAYVYLFTASVLNFSDGLYLLSTWLKQHPDDETLQVAQAYYAAKSSSSRAIAMFGLRTVAPGDQSLMDRFLQKYPANLEVLAFHIEKSIFDGDTARVAELLTQSPPAAEADWRFWRYKGWYHSARNELQQAETACRKALKLHPFDWRSRFELSSVLRRLGRQEQAESMADLALQGKALEKKLLELPNAAAIDGPLLISLHKYARSVGDEQVAAALRARGVPANQLTGVFEP